MISYILAVMGARQLRHEPHRAGAMEKTLTEGRIGLGPVPKHELAYAEIKRQILDGTYSPGHRLVIESLARGLGLSAHPVREAIRRLEAEEWVVFTPNVGAQVRPYNAGEWSGLMSVLAVLSGYATAVAAPNVDVAVAARLRAINRDMEGALADMDIPQFIKMNREFHFAIYELTGAHYLLKQLADAWDRTEVLRQSPFVYRANAASADHERIVQMMEQGEPFEAIEHEGRDHHEKAVVAFRQGAGLGDGQRLRHGDGRH